MRIKLDENIPFRVVTVLAELGHDVDTIVEEGLKGQDDDQIWPATRSAQRFLITRDLDFSDERRYPP